MLVILTTHPIQYQVPIWKTLSARARIPFQVWFMSRHALEPRQDSGFGRTVAWDIDLLGGYDYCFIDVFERACQDSFSWVTLKPGFRRRLHSVGAKALWLQGWQVAAYVQAAYLARASGLEVWLRGETNIRSAGQHRTDGFKALIRRNLLQSIDRVLTIGSRNRAFYIDQGIDPSRFSFTPYGVDNLRFAKAVDEWRPKRDCLRRSWNIDADAFVVLFVGKFQQKKRTFDIVGAVEKMKMSYPEANVHTLWAGSGECGIALRRSTRVLFDAEKHDVEITGDQAAPKASFLGFVNQADIAKVYVAADCLVLPSDADETWGLVVNEAMACGLPCVVSDACGCVDDLIKPVCEELCYRMGDIESLKDALAAVMTSPPRREELQAHVANYDCLSTVKAVEDLYLSTQLCKTPG